MEGGDDWSTRRLGTVLDAEVTAKLGERARRSGVTLSSLVMAANACSGVSASSIPMTVPSTVVRVTSDDAARSGATGPIGRSLWRATLTPWRATDPTRVI